MSLATLTGSVPSKDAVEFMVNLIKALKLHKPVVVSPSASGQLTIPLLVKKQEHIGGFVSLAPVATNSVSSEVYQNIKVKILSLLAFLFHDEYLIRCMNAKQTLAWKLVDVSLTINQILPAPDSTVSRAYDPGAVDSGSKTAREMSFFAFNPTYTCPKHKRSKV